MRVLCMQICGMCICVMYVMCVGIGMSQGNFYKKNYSPPDKKEKQQINRTRERERDGDRERNTAINR